MAKPPPNMPVVGGGGAAAPPPMSGPSLEGEDAELLDPLGDDDGTGLTVTDTPDGGAEVTLEEPNAAAVDRTDFYQNLAEAMPEEELDQLQVDLMRRIDDDKQSRSKRDELYEEGIRRTGLANDAPGGAQFEGASRVVHPMLTKASVDFGSRAIRELCPAKGPVRDNIYGSQTAARIEKARRQTRHMNWQLTKQMPEFRSELEQIISQLSLAGDSYLMAEWDGRYKRPLTTAIFSDQMILPFAASNFRTAERKTWAEPITQATFDGRVTSGYYRDAEITNHAPQPENTKAQTASDKVEGKSASSDNIDGQRIVYRSWTNLSLDIDEDINDGQPLPYVIHMDDTNHKVLAIYRNWAEDDTLFEPLYWVVNFPFVPWRGPMALGLVHLIGNLSAAATGALRALLDAALINNFPTILQLQGVNKGGQTANVQPTEVHKIEGGVASDDIRKVSMQVPFNPPSPALIQLLTFLIEAGEDVVRTTFENLADNSQQMPVGTTLAMLEQGMTVYQAIHARLHAAMAEFLMILHRINKTYLDEVQVLDETGELLVRRADYEGPVDVLPVSDPNIFSETQRYAQIQIVAQRAQLLPQLYNQREVEKAILERTKIDNPDRFLLPMPEVKESNAVAENAMLVFGRPIHAFPDQDHLGHAQVHLDFMTPFLGMMDIIAPKIVQQMLTHLTEHIAFWYVSFMEQEATHHIKEASDGKMDAAAMLKYNDHETRQELDRLFAQISAVSIKQQSEKTFSGMAPVIQQMQGVLQKIQQQQQEAAAAMQQPAAAARVTAAKIAADASTKNKQADVQMHGQETQAQQQADAAKLQLEQNEAAAQQAKDQRQAEIDRLQQVSQVQGQEADRQHAASLAALADQGKRDITTQDNATALTIAEMDNAAGHKSDVTTGTKVAKE